MGEAKKITASYYCRACDVEGRDYEDDTHQALCWCCGEPPKIVYRSTDSSAMLHIPLLYAPHLTGEDNGN